jgi:hypothetical protein
MNLDLPNFREVAATFPVAGDVCDLPSKSWKRLDNDVAPQIQKLVATPIAEIEQLIAELQQAKAYLQSECERLEQETARYVSLTQLASETTTVISDSISQWHPARSDQRSEAHTLSPAVEWDGTVSSS